MANLNQEQLRRLARLGAVARLEQLREEEAAIRALVTRNNALLVAATDNNPQGNAFAERLKGIATAVPCGFERLRPNGGDWNEDLRSMRKEKEGEGKEALPHARRSRQGNAPPGFAGP